ncbi:MAG: insulinase family protein [candidate division WOR-3 bacterium]|nr:insulinase family protein [candidate division WOR-3 bacterium]MCX7947795.1 insulinase family protein [candidate division WOR-3 bacterium]MDW8150752.1 pitrilysin family protein [candidate division WOR-3 bacterium]
MIYFILAEVKTMQKVEEKILENGLEIVAVKKDNLPIFQLSLVISAGSVDDPRGKEGLANLTASLLDEGSKKYTSIEIFEKFEELGTEFSISAGNWSTTISLKSLTENAEKSLEIFSEVLLNPTFPSEELEKLKKRTISNIISQKGDPDYVVRLLLDKELYRKHPLSHPIEGYENTIMNIGRDDIVNFYSKFYLPNNSILVVVSSLEPKKAISLVEKYLSKWKRGELKREYIENIEYPKEKEMLVYHFPGINQAYVFLGAKGISRTNKDFTKLRVVNYMFGGSGFSSRITKVIRVKYGYAYWSYSSLDPGYRRNNAIYEGAFIAGFSTKIGSANHAIELLLEELNKAINEGFTQEELDASKSYYEGSIARQVQTYSQVASIIINAKIWKIPYDYWLRDIQEIKDLKLEEVNKTAKEYLPKNFVVVVLADTTQYKPNVKGFDRVEIKEFKAIEN